MIKLSIPEQFLGGNFQIFGGKISPPKMPRINTDQCMGLFVTSTKKFYIVISNNLPIYFIYALIYIDELDVFVMF